jgi:hypothetical protein
MDIGDPIREHTITPAEEPFPHELPIEAPAEAPAELPDPVPAEPEKVPA